MQEKEVLLDYTPPVIIAHYNFLLTDLLLLNGAFSLDFFKSQGRRKQTLVEILLGWKENWWDVFLGLFDFDVIGDKLFGLFFKVSADFFFFNA